MPYDFIPMNPRPLHTFEISIQGLVQGVGFRPFVYRVAAGLGLKGRVENRSNGVKIQVTCPEEDLVKFILAIRERAPLASSIFSIEYNTIPTIDFDRFSITASTEGSAEITEISPDIAVCSDCLADMKHQENRIGYPFTNCTNCGPRFTIIRDLPYDREKTTMEPFVMCETCRAEFADVHDRRFHAQPVACNRCGPQYELIERERRITGIGPIIDRICEWMETGGVVAIKGMGGFFIACDAMNPIAVERLRAGKKREGKPFAVMFSSLDAAKEFTVTSPEEEALLLSWRRPIVLLQERKKLAPGVSMGFPTIGAMLPYMPFHHMLFEKLNLKAIVLTSGNLSDEPILIDNDRAIEQLSHLVDGVLVYNRDIFNRTDDSVTVVVNGQERLIRRSRGYVPSPIRLHQPVEGILATGSELVNCFCIGKGRLAIPSQHIGDLKNPETLAFYEESVSNFKRMFRFLPRFVAADMHPDYLSTRYAMETGLEIIKVQHHHAHIASCMAEHGLDEPVIGIAFDGVGYGDDGCIWGGEFLVCDLADYRRHTHFEYLPMPGGDRATEEPWRMAVSYLYHTFGSRFMEIDIPFIHRLDPGKVNMVVAAIDRQINCPLTSSAGRLFDAVSALTGLCMHPGFHAEAPMRLEAAANPASVDRYTFDTGKTIGFCSMFREIVTDLKNGITPGLIAAKFHNTVTEATMVTVRQMKADTGLNKVALSGGSFQNRYLLSGLELRLRKENFQVYSNLRVPSNDGGVALGQLVVAAKRVLHNNNVE
jgi:hydrogenase maturation protein HypF